MINYSEEIKGMNLWEKVANISAEIESIQKDDEVGAGKSKYKAISIEKVVRIVGEKMSKYGVVIYPVQQNYTRTDEKVIGIDYNTKKEVEKINRVSDVDVVYQVVNIHSPQEIITTVASGCGVDTQDKGVGKAQTYAYKNMLLKLFAIPTGDDTDKIHSDDYTNKLYGYKEKEINEEMIFKLYELAMRKGVTQAQINNSAKKDYDTLLCDLKKMQYEEMYARISKLEDK